MVDRWKKIAVAPDATISDTLKVIDKESLQIAFVTNKSSELLGSVTDGDIRRALLRGLSLSDSVKEVMNSAPKYANFNEPEEISLRRMRDNKIVVMPKVKDGRIIGLIILNEHFVEVKLDNPVFIMAGGFGTRLRPLTDKCPKPMLPIGDKPILEILLENFITAGFHNFYISTHYLPEMIHQHFGDGEKWGVNIQYIHESTPLGTGGALGLLPREIMSDLPLILINGDILTTLNFQKLLNFHEESNSLATMCVREYEYQIPFGVINSSDDIITGMDEKPTYRHHVNAGIYVISKSLVSSVEKNEYLDMPTLLSRFTETKKIKMFTFHNYWLDIGRHNDYEKAQHDIKTLRATSSYE